MTNPLTLIMTSQSVITAIKTALHAEHPIAIADLDTKLNTLSDALDVLRLQVSLLIEQQAEAVTAFSEGEDLASDLMDELKDLEKYDEDLNACTIEEVAKELYDTAEDLYFLMSSGVNR
ncbi:MAG: hypothetical protein Q7S87_05915 [Agitococcus sp.]|nr:hypothetical protein [Agitococcus sp.]